LLSLTIGLEDFFLPKRRLIHVGKKK